VHTYINTPDQNPDSDRHGKENYIIHGKIIEIMKDESLRRLLMF
jgi:hypothetical protein